MKDRIDRYSADDDSGKHSSKRKGAEDGRTTSNEGRSTSDRRRGGNDESRRGKEDDRSSRRVNGTENGDSRRDGDRSRDRKDDDDRRGSRREKSRPIDRDAAQSDGTSKDRGRGREGSDSGHRGDGGRGDHGGRRTRDEEGRKEASGSRSHHDSRDVDGRSRTSHREEGRDGSPVKEKRRRGGHRSASPSPSTSRRKDKRVEGDRGEGRKRPREDKEGDDRHSSRANGDHRHSNRSESTHQSHSRRSRSAEGGRERKARDKDRSRSRSTGKSRHADSRGRSRSHARPDKDGGRPRREESGSPSRQEEGWGDEGHDRKRIRRRSEDRPMPEGWNGPRPPFRRGLGGRGGPFPPRGMWGPRGPLPPRMMMGRGPPPFEGEGRGPPRPMRGFRDEEENEGKGGRKTVGIYGPAENEPPGEPPSRGGRGTLGPEALEGPRGPPMGAGPRGPRGGRGWDGPMEPMMMWGGRGGPRPPRGVRGPPGMWDGPPPFMGPGPPFNGPPGARPPFLPPPFGGRGMPRGPGGPPFPGMMGPMFRGPMGPFGRGPPFIDGMPPFFDGPPSDFPPVDGSPFKRPPGGVKDEEPHDRHGGRDRRAMGRSSSASPRKRPARHDNKEENGVGLEASKSEVEEEDDMGISAALRQRMKDVEGHLGVVETLRGVPLVRRYAGTQLLTGMREILRQGADYDRWVREGEEQAEPQKRSVLDLGGEGGLSHASVLEDDLDEGYLTPDDEQGDGDEDGGDDGFDAPAASSTGDGGEEDDMADLYGDLEAEEPAATNGRKAQRDVLKAWEDLRKPVALPFGVVVRRKDRDMVERLYKDCLEVTASLVQGGGS